MVHGGKNKKYMDPAADIGRNPVSNNRFSLSVENEKADTGRDGQTCLAKPKSPARTVTGKCFPVQLTTNRIGNLTQLICTLLYLMTIYAYIYTVTCTQLPSIIEVPRGCCGHASGIYFPRPLWFGGCAIHATPCSVPGYSYCTMCLEKSERSCLTSYWCDLNPCWSE